MIIKREALQAYCVLVRNFGFENSWEAFEKFQYKFKDCFNKEKM